MAFYGFTGVNVTFCADFESADARGGDGVAVHQLSECGHGHGDGIFTVSTESETLLRGKKNSNSKQIINSRVSCEIK